MYEIEVCTCITIIEDFIRELIKVAELTRWIVWHYCCALRYLLFVSNRSELIKVAELNRWIV